MIHVCWKCPCRPHWPSPKCHASRAICFLPLRVGPFMPGQLHGRARAFILLMGWWTRHVACSRQTLISEAT